MSCTRRTDTEVDSVRVDSILYACFTTGTVQITFQIADDGMFQKIYAQTFTRMSDCWRIGRVIYLNLFRPLHFIRAFYMGKNDGR